ncbi:MAG TPA: flagellar hook-associated protein FlgK, partial [Rhodobiaceae bacterium]|nr:flagellar hook-associated protein FlgK [Rhodobiaceae bacterium]
TDAVDGAATGFDIDTSDMVAGNTINLSYTVGGVRQDVTIVRVDDPSVLPLSDSVTAATGDTVIGINFDQPMANIIADLQA